MYLNPGSAGPRRFRLPVTVAGLDFASQRGRSTRRKSGLGQIRLPRGPFMEQIGLELQGAEFDLLEPKFEPERLRVVLFLAVRAHGVDIELGGLV
jgi:hypothetical protein